MQHTKNIFLLPTSCLPAAPAGVRASTRAAQVVAVVAAAARAAAPEPVVASVAAVAAASAVEVQVWAARALFAASAHFAVAAGGLAEVVYFPPVAAGEQTCSHPTHTDW